MEKYDERDFVAREIKADLMRLAEKLGEKKVPFLFYLEPAAGEDDVDASLLARTGGGRGKNVRLIREIANTRTGDELEAALIAALSTHIAGESGPGAFVFGVLLAMIILELKKKLELGD